MAAVEARRALELANGQCRNHTGQYEHDEDVHEQREPPLVAEPRKRGIAIHRADQRHEDRGEEDQEAPEDRGVHESRAEPLEKLPLAEDDHGLVARAARDVVEARRRLAHPHEVHEQLRPAGEQTARERQGRRQRERSEQDVYCDRAFLSAAVIAGTISVRSPITA